MYSDRRKRTGLWAGVLLAVAAAAVLLGLLASRVQRRDLREESAQAIQTAIERGALQCYVVEGVYPPNLQYLEDHYGLQVNTVDYYVTYDAFASNLPPAVRVVQKAGQ